MDCFATLAMTAEHTFAFSRRWSPEVCILVSPPEYQQINPSLLYAAMGCFARNDVWIQSAHDERA
jgi:hypothetical protein